MDAPPPEPPPIQAVMDESLTSLALSTEPGTWQAGLISKFSTLDGRAASLMGLRAGLLRREKHVLSLAGYRRVGSLATNASSQHRSLDFRYGGLLLGWESDGLSLIQNYAHLLVGAGQARATERLGASLRSRPLVILEPEMGLVWKLSRSVRGQVGISWRGVWNNTLDGLSRNALDGWSASLGVLVGLYPPAIPQGVIDARGSVGAREQVKDSGAASGSGTDFSFNKAAELEQPAGEPEVRKP